MVSGALRRHGLSVAGIITALVLGACSSSQSGVEAATTTAQSALGASTASKIEFLEGGNSICVEVGANLATFDREVRRQGASGAAIAKLLNGYAEFQTTILEKLQALQQPPDDDGQLAAVYAKESVYIEAARNAAIPAAANDEAAYEPLVAAMNDAAKHANAAYIAYGLAECGGGATI